MARYTIAQLREVSLDRFNSNYIHDYDSAKNLVTRFYRLCGMYERLLVLENDCTSWKLRSTKSLGERAERMYTRLKEDLKAYGLTLSFSSYTPDITLCGGPVFIPVFDKWFYQ